MDSTPPQYEGDNYLLPSTFSPWRNDNSTNSADNQRSTTAAYAARPGIESAASPNPYTSLASSNALSFSLGRRASSTFYPPQPLNVPSPTVLREPPNMRAFARQSPIVMSPPRSSRSAASAETFNSPYSSETERQTSQGSTVVGSSWASPTEQGGPAFPAVSNVDARKSAAFFMPKHPKAESIPMSAIYSPVPSQNTMVSEDEGEAEHPSPRYANSHLNCYSRGDVYIKRWSWLYIALIILSVYSTAFSGLWFVVSILQPQYGRSVSTGIGWQILPSTATLLTTLAAKTIELSFVTVFVAVLGQVLTRRAFSKLSSGITLAEMTMRNWVIQPGSLITHWENIPSAATTFLGALTLTATICSLFYTTASDAMVSPKLVRQGWIMRDLKGLVKASYANPKYVLDSCQSPLRNFIDTKNQEATLYSTSCLEILFSGQSYQSLITFLAEWDAIHESGSPYMHRQLETRPIGKHNLLDNTTMDSSWIETEYGDIEANFKTHNRIINNVTLAMPHAGVYAAATDHINGILQPDELMGLGEYSIKASVVSPVVNVMCVNMNEEELAPLVYTTWPDAQIEDMADIPGRKIGKPGWGGDVAADWINQTVVDDIFKWGGGPDGRRPPAFQLYPIDYNMITNATTGYTNPLYILGKSGVVSDYTLCELRSWVTTNCSTQFDLSGTSGGHMKAHCEDPNDPNAYRHISDAPPVPSGDWRNLAESWRLSMDLNGGVQNNNASNARVLTRLALDKPALDPLLPSMAEAVAVLASSTLAAGSLDSTFMPAWTYDTTHNNTIPGTYEPFRAQVQTQQYTSTHTASWQVIFYPVLGLTFVLNVLCLLYLVSGTSLTSFSTTAAKSSPSSSWKKRHPSFSPSLSFPISFKRGAHNRVKTSPTLESDSENEDPAPAPGSSSRGGMRQKGKAAKGLVTDYTEPQNLFTLAVNSPPSRALAGSCGRGPDASGMSVPWYVGYAAGANHYFFEEGAKAGRRGAVGMEGGPMSSGVDLLGVDGDGGDDGRYGKSYKRLSSRRPWL
ncbi:hypothetical protein F4859DRAFT_515011 [Xylaria cf. heliscus]|nr:hypothetical protein F4859DRAFT_515011 [Xylaria cf. heliscus]